jgi:alkylation response protein AidB-like acyl-CoA dehydrogenase
VTSAGHARSYVVSALSPHGSGPTNTTLYLVPNEVAGLSIAGRWDGLGLRANASAPMVLDDCHLGSELRLTEDGAGFQAMMSVVLPSSISVPHAWRWGCAEPRSRRRPRI